MSLIRQSFGGSAGVLFSPILVNWAAHRPRIGGLGCFRSTLPTRPKIPQTSLPGRPKSPCIEFPQMSKSQVSMEYKYEGSFCSMQFCWLNMLGMICEFLRSIWFHSTYSTYVQVFLIKSVTQFQVLFGDRLCLKKYSVLFCPDKWIQLYK